MTQTFKDSLKCPNCKKKVEFTRWGFLNSAIDANAKKQLIDGTLLTYTCPHCGHQDILEYAMFFFDVNRHAAIYLLPDMPSAKAKKQYAAVAAELLPPQEDLVKRIVSDVNTLREKAMIFDCELDDRIVEMMKLFHYSTVREQAPDVVIEDGYFVCDNGNLRFLFIGSETIFTDFTREEYDEFAADYAERLDALGNDELLIDPEWARKFLTE